MSPFPIAFQNAFFRLLHSSTLECGIVESVRAGGDTDTNAAIAGALLGLCMAVRPFQSSGGTEFSHAVR